MELNNSTVLITGGSSGIGFEMAKRLIQKKNKVIICSRSENKLQRAKSAIPEVEIYQCDISKLDECKALADWVKKKYDGCNVLINNAAIVHKCDFSKEEHVINHAREEIDTNLLAPIVLSKHFIPILEQNSHPQIINITTGLIYAPKATYPFYNATKAALHSFTQVLRLQLKDSPIKVKEVMLPAVDTPWHNGKPPKIAIPVQKAVEALISGLKKDKSEIRVAGAKLLYMISRIAPKFALSKVNSLD